MQNYKGLFYNDQKEKHYYEGGAHFKYKHLVKILEDLKEKQDQKENERQIKNKNNSLEHNQNQNKGVLINDNRHNFLRSPNKEKNIDYIEQLLNFNSVKHSKKATIKLKEIKSVDRKNDIVLNTENNRYHEMNIRNNSLELNKNLNLKNNTNEYKNIILLTEHKNNSKNKESKLKINFDSYSNTKSYKNLQNLISLPKIESSYFNSLSKKNINENSNSNIATKSTNRKTEFIKPKMEKEKEIEYEFNKDSNRVDKKPDYLFFSLNKKLPKLNYESMSALNNNKQNINLDKNRQLFTINAKNKEESLYNNIKNINGDNKANLYNNSNLYNNYNLRSIQLNKNSQRILKLNNEDKDKDKDKNKISIKSILFSPKRKKTHRKKTKKYKSLEEE